MNSSRIIKVATIGDVSVGKTSLIKRYVDNEFSQEEQSTIGVVYFEKEVFYAGSFYKIQLYDTAGQERFRSLTKQYYQKADVVLMLYDITSKDSFDTLQHWSEEVAKNAPSRLIRVVVGNKIDMMEREEVDGEFSAKYAEEMGALFALVSAKKDIGIKALFEKICQEYSLRNPASEMPTQSSNVSIDNNKQEDKSFAGCSC